MDFANDSYKIYEKIKIKRFSITPPENCDIWRVCQGDESNLLCILVRFDNLWMSVPKFRENVDVTFYGLTLPKIRRFEKAYEYWFYQTGYIQKEVVEADRVDLDFIHYLHQKELGERKISETVLVLEESW